MYQFPYRRKFALCEKLIVSSLFIIHLGTKTPKKIFLGSFNQPCRIVSKFGLHLLFSALLQNFFSVQNVILLWICQVRVMFSVFTFYLLFWNFSNDFNFIDTIRLWIRWLRAIFPYDIVLVLICRIRMRL